MERLAVAVCGVGLESFTCTEKLFVPGVLGVPEITPEALKDRPAGKELPPANEKVSGKLPPLATTVAL